MKQKLPAKIYVYREEDANETFLIPNENFNDIPEGVDGEEVGVYILQDVKKFTVKRELK